MASFRLRQRQAARRAFTGVAVLFGALISFTVVANEVHAACAPSIFVGYSAVNAYDASTQAVIDLNGATAGTSASVGGSTTYDMVATPDGSKLLIATGAGIAVMDTATNAVTRITTTGTYWAVVVNSSGTTAYATNNTNSRIDIIDVATNSINGSIALSAAPSAMAIKPDDSQLWIRFNYVDGIAIVDTATQTVLDSDTNTAGTQFFFAGNTTSTVSSGQGIDFNPSGTRAVVSNFSNGTISFINTVTMQMVDINGATAGLNTPTVGSQSIRRVKYSPDGLRIFAMLTSPTFYVRVYAADFSTYTDISQVNYPIDIAFLPNGKFAVANFNPGSLSFFSSSGSDSSWGGTYTRDADVTYNSAYAIEYGCASSLSGPTTTTTTTTTTTVAPSSTTTTTSSSTSLPATTSTTVAPQSTTTTLATSATVPLVSTTTTTVRPVSTTSSPSSTSTTSTTVLIVAGSSTTTSTEAPTTTINAAEAVEQFIGVTVEDVDKIAEAAESERGGALFIGGKAVKVETKTTLASYTMAYLNAAVKVECFDRDGKAINLSADSRFEVRRGDRVKVTVVGFKPGSVVKVAVFSNPSALGSIEADVNGDGVKQWIIPDSLSAGTHTLVTSGDLRNVKDAVFGLRVIIDNPSFVTRVATSTATRVILALGVLFGLLIPATRRRRREQTNS